MQCARIGHLRLLYWTYHRSQKATAEAIAVNDYSCALSVCEPPLPVIQCYTVGKRRGP